jgi:biotin operon repressor
MPPDEVYLEAAVTDAIKLLEENGYTVLNDEGWNELI